MYGECVLVLRTRRAQWVSDTVDLVSIWAFVYNGGVVQTRKKLTSFFLLESKCEWAMVGNLRYELERVVSTEVTNVRGGEVVLAYAFAIMGCSMMVL